tara:strand:- start:162 stop:695 length:534 start_codon:yes stop_codon:yes gene_type:complete
MANPYGGDVAASRFKNDQQKRTQLQKNKTDAKASQLRAWKKRMKKLGYTVDATNTAYSKTGTRMGSFEGGMKKSLKIKKEQPKKVESPKNDNNKKTDKPKYKQVTQKELDAKIKNPDSKVKGKDKPKDSLKIKKGSARNFIKTKKGFARRGTPMAKRAEERERKRKALGAKGYMKNK